MCTRKCGRFREHEPEHRYRLEPWTWVAQRCYFKERLARKQCSLNISSCWTSWQFTASSSQSEYHDHKHEQSVVWTWRSACTLWVRLSAQRFETDGRHRNCVCLLSTKLWRISLQLGTNSPNSSSRPMCGKAVWYAVALSRPKMKKAVGPTGMIRIVLG